MTSINKNYINFYESNHSYFHNKYQGTNSLGSTLQYSQENKAPVRKSGSVSPSPASVIHISSEASKL